VVAQQVIFWILAFISVAAALAVVGLQDVFRAAIALVVCFLVVAGIYILLTAEFLAVIQILIYVGAISVIIILAIMMSREYHRASTSNRFRVPAFFISLILLGVIMFAFLGTKWGVEGSPSVTGGVPVQSSQNVALALFGQNSNFALPIEIGGLLLLAAVIGAIVLLRDRDNK
jgi:NADH-quinone oxidoreductase subunit J